MKPKLTPPIYPTNESSIDDIPPTLDTYTEETKLLDSINAQMKQDKEQGTASPFGILFNLVNTTIGAGIVTLPFAHQSCGIVLGPIFLLTVAFMACYSLWLLLLSSAKTQKYSYRELAVHVFGHWSGIFFEACIVTLCFGVCIVYILLIGLLNTYY